jgi:hypothetical protein
MLRQSGELRARLAGREHQRDRFGQQSPGCERHRLRGGLVQPLRIVNYAKQRPLGGHLRQQAKHS